MTINDSRRFDARQQRCDALADWLDEAGAQRGLRLLQSTGWWPVAEQESADEAAVEVPGASAEDLPRAISIWQPETAETADGKIYFERPVPSPLGDHYCRRRRFSRDKADGVQRICWFGESAAAGYLYAPHYSPAAELQSRFAGSSGSAEVVDLARTNENLTSLVATVAAAQQLAPDVMVIYAGNNCQLLELPELSPWFPSVRSRQELAGWLRQGGLAAVAQQAHRRLQLRIRSRLAELVQAAAGVPLILVFPEVDLLGWHQRQPVPWLPGDGVAQWYELYERAVAALDRADYDAALTAADRMAELDSGLCPTAQRIRCMALVGQQASEEALTAARAEVDAAQYVLSCFLGAPQAGALVHQEWLAVAKRHDHVALVDSRVLLARRDGLPDPAHFVDYCHLSAAGIQRLMDGIVEELSRRGLATAASSSSKSRDQSGPSAEVEALAQLGAAVHAAHRWTAVGSRRAGLLMRCRAALAANAGVKDAMWQLLAARCAPLPEVLTAAQQDNRQSPFAFELQHGWRWHGLDIELIEVLITVLEDTVLEDTVLEESTEPGESEAGQVRGRVNEWLLRHHGVRPCEAAADGKQGAIDISRQPYLWDPLEQSFVYAMATPDKPLRSFFKAYWPASRFALIAVSGIAVDAEVILRAPHAASGEDAVIELDGQEVARFGVAAGWRRHRLNFTVPSSPSAIHQLTVRWPSPSQAHADAALGLAVERLESGWTADFHPVFGEVLSLLVKSAVSTTSSASPAGRPDSIREILKDRGQG